MAHFAQLDDSNTVLQVVVVSNADLLDADGNESEVLGAAVCEAVVGPGPWVQTSYNSKMRRRYAGIGMTYLPEHDAFILPQPYPSWTLDLNNLDDWVPPITRPDEECENGWWKWNETEGNWECNQPNDDPQ